MVIRLGPGTDKTRENDHAHAATLRRPRERATAALDEEHWTTKISGTHGRRLLERSQLRGEVLIPREVPRPGAISLSRPAGRMSESRAEPGWGRGRTRFLRSRRGRSARAAPPGAVEPAAMSMSARSRTALSNRRT